MVVTLFARDNKYFRINSISAKIGINSSKITENTFDIPNEHYTKLKIYPSVSVNFFKRESIQHKFIASYNIVTQDKASFYHDSAGYFNIKFINGAYVLSIFPPKKSFYPYLDIGPFIAIHIKDNLPWDWSNSNYFNKVCGGILTNIGIKYENDIFDIFMEISRNGYIIPLVNGDDFEYWISSYSASIGISFML